MSNFSNTAWKQPQRQLGMPNAQGNLQQDDQPETNWNQNQQGSYVNYGQSQQQNYGQNYTGLQGAMRGGAIAGSTVNGGAPQALPSSGAPQYGAAYLVGKRRIEDNYNVGSAANKYSEVLEKNRAMRDARSLKQRYDQDRTAQAFQHNGFGRGGGQRMYAQNNYMMGHRNQLEQAATQNYDTMNRLRMAQEQLLRDRNYGMEDLEVQDAQRRIDMAIRAANF